MQFAVLPQYLRYELTYQGMSNYPTISLEMWRTWKSNTRYFTLRCTCNLLKVKHFCTWQYKFPLISVNVNVRKIRTFVENTGKKTKLRTFLLQANEGTVLDVNLKCSPYRFILQKANDKLRWNFYKVKNIVE